MDLKHLKNGKLSIWVLFNYDFDENFQRADLDVIFIESFDSETFKNGFCITNKNKNDEKFGIHVNANINAISITEISREKYVSDVENGLIKEDSWPDFGVEMFCSWKNLWKNYQNYKKDDFVFEESSENSE